MTRRPTPGGEGRRRNNPTADHHQLPVSLRDSCVAEATDEIALRVEAATVLLAAALVDQLPIGAAALGALRHLQRVELLMRVGR